MNELLGDKDDILAYADTGGAFPSDSLAQAVFAGDNIGAREVISRNRAWHFRD